MSQAPPPITSPTPRQPPYTHSKQSLRRQFQTAAEDAARLPALQAEHARIKAEVEERDAVVARLKQVFEWVNG